VGQLSQLTQNTRVDLQTPQKRIQQVAHLTLEIREICEYNEKRELEWGVSMTTHLNAEMLRSTGAAAAPIEEAIGTVKKVLCQPQDTSKDVYAVIFRAKHKSGDKPDHLLVMNAVISAARRCWHEVSKRPTKRGWGSNARRAATIDVTEHNGIRIYRGCSTPEEFQKTFVPEEGIYIFPSHLKLNTVEQLGLEPLPKSVKASRIVLQVGIEDEAAPKTLSEGLDRESRAWREHFISHYKALSATEVADETGNTAKNRSALASRWASDKKIFGVRFQNQTLYPAFQFKDGEPISAVADILKEIPSSFTGWDLAFFFTSPNSYLDEKLPVDLLKSKPERVVALAHAFAHAADAF
jgi:hypothetical protein